MTEERPQGRPGPDGPDDDAVPHPFGPGRLGERPAEVEAAAESEPEPSTSDEPAVEAEAEPESPIEDEVEDTAEPEESTEPEDAAEPEETAEPEPEPGDAAEPEPARSKVAITARRRRDPLAAALIGVLTLLLGFAFAVQVRNVGNDQALSGAREEDLVRILDDLNAREERLREQISDQRTALQQLTSSDSQSATALEEARKRAEAIGILNGTVPAQGPGLTMTIRDPDDAVRVADILDAIQELRGAGAETMQIDGVRVGVSTAVTGDPGGLMIDGRPITTPYEFVVIGDPQNMETAMNIPGGVVPRINSRGGSVTIEPADEVVVDALRPLDTPQYASPATGN
jgi:uncharacterized protein YlxW (UPF0749 family)